MKHWMIGIAAKFAAMFVIGLAAFGTAVMLLWNWLIPELFNGPTVTFWQSVGLLALAHILVRGWTPWHGGHHWKHNRWKHKFEEKLAAMTPEEREKFKEEYRKRCGWTPDQEKHPC